MQRPLLIENIVKNIVNIKQSSPTLIAIDGLSGAGKTILADELVKPIESIGRSVIRATVDNFYHPRQERHKGGADSPEGYFYNAFNYDALKMELLDPLSFGGNLKYRTAIFDPHRDIPICEPQQDAHHNVILLFDGVFLFRQELYNYWNYRIFVFADFDVTLQRVIKRDQKYFGSSYKVFERFKKRRIPGQLIYLTTVQPEKLADVIIKNNNPNDPEVTTNEIIKK